MSFHNVWFADIVDEVPIAPIWLINRLVVLGSFGVLAGDPKAGKSELTYQLAVSVATGQPFLGFETRQSGVLLVVAEESRDAAVQRLKHFKLPHGLPVSLWTEDVVDSPTNRLAMGAWLLAHREIRLVIVDTLASYLLLTDETDSSHVTARLKPYMDLAHHAACTILFIHHLRKNQDGNDGSFGDLRTVRGSTAITGLADTIYQLHKPAGGGRRDTARILRISSRHRDVLTRLTLDYPRYPEGGYERVHEP